MKDKLGLSYLNATAKSNKSSYFTVVWTKIYDLISSNIQNPKGNSGKWIWSAYPENLLTEDNSEKEIRGQYPIIVIEPVSLTTYPLTITDETTDTLEITLEIYSDRADYLDVLSDSLINLLLNSRDYLYKLNIVNIKVSGITYSHFFRASVPIHVRTIRFSCIVGD